MSAVGAPLMFYIGHLCQQGSPMVQIPDEQKPDAGQGCMAASALYALTFLVAYVQMKKAQEPASARELQKGADGKLLMPVNDEQTDYRPLGAGTGSETPGASREGWGVGAMEMAQA
eukprot:CAMPEP_0175266178 /NCGR_PEP_ID=MMETSP0093-20121207/43198_1 /TAXON_ID=311494 /ORGANISM="Alexandrium monilatum, Strain CCMP3105" /LENGTH=115 /DNA_ID=CAMNT_0016560773 /DNA_START=106 /DNA_END=451 /DNA_ORIENTATION=-